MNKDRLIEATERAIRRSEKELAQLQDALGALKGRPGRRSTRGRGRLRNRLTPGRLPALVFGMMKEINKPATLGEIVMALCKKQPGMSVSTRQLSLALARYVREERYFRITEDGKYELIEE